jgi:hypothetical protein
MSFKMMIGLGWLGLQLPLKADPADKLKIPQAIDTVISPAPGRRFPKTPGTVFVPRRTREKSFS